MTSDSDVEAYLNQLSKKTYSLKKDLESRQDPSSSCFSGAVDKYADDLSSLSEVNPLELQISASTKYHQRKEPAGSIHDIAALSNKYSDLRSRRAKSDDKFSNLEQKYLNKYTSNKSVMSSKHLRRDDKRKLPIDPSEVGIRTDADKRNTRELILPVQEDSIPSDISTVEDLANFLDEAALQKSQLEKTPTLHEKQSGSEDDIWDVNNVMTVDDILGGVNYCDVDTSTTENEDNFRTLCGNRNPSRDSKSHFIGEEEETVLAFKSVRQPAKQDTDGDINNGYYQPVGILLAQASSNVFHSSRRKSSIDFNIENLAKLLPHQKENIDPEAVPEENISSPESNVAELVVETEASVEDISVEEHITHENNTMMAEQQFTKLAHPTSSDNHENISYQTSGHAKSGSFKLASCDMSDKSSVPTHKQVDESLNVNKISKDPESSDEKGSLPKSTNKYAKISGQRPKRDKKKNKHNKAYSSEWSNNESLGSECVEHRHGHRDKPKHRSCGCDHWCGPPTCIQWRPHCCHHVFTSPSDIFTTELQSYILKGNRTVPEALGVEQLMKQQVALIRQFLECQQNMYQAYTATLTTDHRYTTLRITEKYIKKKQRPPLTFKEAYRLVKEEMESSKL